MEVGSQFQWIKSEYTGEIDVVKEIDTESNKVIFESNREVFMNIMHEVMIELQGGTPYIDVVENTAGKELVVDNISNIPTTTQLPPVAPVGPSSNIVNIEGNENIPSILTTLQKSAEKSEGETLEITLNLNGLPNLSVITMLYEVFDPEDVDKALVVFLENKIEDVISQIGKALKKD